MKQALLLIDIQNDYFPAGHMPLVGSAEAAGQANSLERQFPIVRTPGSSCQTWTRRIFPLDSL